MSRYAETMSEDDRKAFNEQQAAAVEKEYQEFLAAHAHQNCYLCGRPYSSFETTVCAHWLMNPAGFRKKKHFLLVTKKYSFHQLQCFLRWLAKTEGFSNNINDLSVEGTGKLREVTIRYKEFEWSFSCTENDFKGHGSGLHQQPHYHFQMRKGPSTIIRYNDFHVAFSADDIREIAAEIATPRIKRRWPHGEGMSEVFQEEVINAMLDRGMQATDKEEQGATLKFDYLIRADEGTTIKGDDVAAMIEERKRTGLSIGSQLRQGRLANVSIQTVVTPGPSVVEQKTRSGRGGEKVQSE